MAEFLVLSFKNPQYFENNVTFMADSSEGMGMSVSEEKEMDSYNFTFCCHFSMTPNQAIQLRDYINKFFG